MRRSETEFLALERIMGIAVSRSLAVLFALFIGCVSPLPAAEVVIAEGEHFKPLDQKGWRVVHQDDSYASHSYGGMWSTHGGLLGAPADSVQSVASQIVTVSAAGSYRVWSKYQAPPYFNYLHKIEVLQNGKKVFEHTYGRKGTDRLWSFSGVSDELWWFWGADHDAAEAPKTLVQLAAGPAEVRITAVENVQPAGDRYIDFVVLTTEPGDTYQGFKPYAVGSPFTVEALAQSRVYLRFKNHSAAPAKLKLNTPTGHYQPNYGARATEIPEAAPVAPGQWSPWVNIGPFCRLVHDEGIVATLPGATGPIEIEAARDASGTDQAGALRLPNGETFLVPLDLTWNRSRSIFASQARAEELTRLARKEWRTRNEGRKPQSILYYGLFYDLERPWVAAFKDAVGYNTLLPDAYPHAAIDGYHQHCHNPAELKAYVGKLSEADKKKFKVMSFGDEISLGEIAWNDPALQTKFTAWLKSRGVQPVDLGGLPLEAAKLADRSANRRVGWYAQTFNEEERFGAYRDLTVQAKALLGPQVETGANYSPHGMPMYYGPIYQWVDIFKHNGMTMYWAEDYIFSVPMPPQIISWMLSTVRCAVKYNKQKVHFYVMPHAPGQRADFLRRSMIYAPGAGVNHVDNFWVAPPERHTENSVAWGYADTYRAIHESIYDTAEAEPFLAGATVRPGRTAVLLSKATDHNERLAQVPKSQDALMAKSKNAPDTIQQTLGRVEAQMLYLALLHGQHRVDLITEDDIALDNILSKYDVVHVAGEWLDHRVPAKLEAWVKAGGILYASGGLGIYNEFNEPDPTFLKLLGLKSVETAKNLAVIRPTLELPVAPPIGEIAFEGGKIPAVGLKQALSPAEAAVLGKWADGKPAVTVRELGKGKAFAVGTLAGCAYMKTGLPVQPFARGGNRCPVTPTMFDAAAGKLARLGVDVKSLEEPAVCDNPFVEALVMDGPKGSAVTLVNWTDKPLAGLKVAVRVSTKPTAVRSVQAGKAVPHEFRDGILTVTTDLEWADYLLLAK
jgi:hypothetical protein